MKDDCCSICLDNKTTIFSVIPCGHEFCDSCIFEWLEQHKTCPLCRCNVNKTLMTKCRDSYFGGDKNLLALAMLIGIT